MFLVVINWEFELEVDVPSFCFNIGVKFATWIFILLGDNWSTGVNLGLGVNCRLLLDHNLGKSCKQFIWDFGGVESVSGLKGEIFWKLGKN